ncbi:MAG: hypothetical protein IJ012_02525, partial [Clostridia bacterium]|nr:hypothetical protein [Clostridia bacterium]
MQGFFEEKRKIFPAAGAAGRFFIAEESRTLSVFAGKNSPQHRQNSLQYLYIASKFFLAATNFFTA